MQRASSWWAHRSIKYGLPRIHGCIWDRHCRSFGGPRRISIAWNRYYYWVDLPGYDKAMTYYNSRDLTDIQEHVPASWQLLPQFRCDISTKERHAKFRTGYLEMKARRKTERDGL